MKLLVPSAYYQQLLTAISGAQRRIVLAAMVVLADKTTTPIFNAIRAALDRGVAVHVLYDAYQHLGGGRPANLSRTAYRQLVIHTDQTLASLRRAGARVSLVGKTGLNPYKGRCHIKITVVDDMVYSFGGINFSADSFAHADYLLHVNNTSLADSLSDLVGQIASGLPLADFEYPIGNDTRVLFDAGVPGSSIIYERANQLAHNAARIWYVSQMVPTGRLARAIRSTDYKCYFNHPARGQGGLRLALAVDKIITGLANSYGRDRFIHAKCMLFDLKDGSKALMSGSHNFNWRGSVYGTKEIALYSTNTTLWQQLYKFVEQEIQ